jgi:predicted DNA-binding transcriptional regulator AlpA
VVTKKPGSMHIDKRAGWLAAEDGERSDEDVLTTAEVAAWLGVSRQFLEIARHKNTGPKYKQLSPRLVMYQRGDVRKWLRERTRLHTKQKVGRR